MTSRAVVTPENLSKDFAVDTTVLDGRPVKLNLSKRLFSRDPTSGEIATSNLARATVVGYGSVASMKADTTLLAGDQVRTRGYTTSFDGGSAEYIVMSQASFGSAAPDGLIDHLLDNGRVAVLQHNREIDAQQCGVQDGIESSDAWNNAFWRASALASANNPSTVNPVTFICTVNVLANKTLHMSKKPADPLSPGGQCVVDVYHPGCITAVGGGTFETHLNNEMARLTALHGSPVTLGSALAAKFLKADPQLPEFLGDKIERPIPLISFCCNRATLALGTVKCDFWCSGIRIDRALCTEIAPGMSVQGYRKYGLLYTKNSNNAIKSHDITAKQIGLADFGDYDGRIMTGGYLESRNFTGDALAICQKDMMWFGGNTGWGRTAVTLLDMCHANESDRWAGRTMYPDYFSRWNDSAWLDHGGKIYQPEWDHMAPSTGTGDCDFYGMHVMQGVANTTDEEATPRMDGVAFGGQPGFECWNDTNAVHIYGADIDSSLVLCFGSSIRLYQPTGGGANTATGGIFDPQVRFFPCRSTNLASSHVESVGMTIGIFPFDNGRDGVPDIRTFGGDYTLWNSRNRPYSGSYIGPVQYRGILTGGVAPLPSASVLAVGDYFWVMQDGVYGGQAFSQGDIAYALTLAPGTAFGANWYRGLNQNTTAKNADKIVTLRKPVNELIARNSDVPANWVSKPGGKTGYLYETGVTGAQMVFDGADQLFDQPGGIILKTGSAITGIELQGVLGNSAFKPQGGAFGATTAYATDSYGQFSYLKKSDNTGWITFHTHVALTGFALGTATGKVTLTGLAAPCVPGGNSRAAPLTVLAYGFPGMNIAAQMIAGSAEIALLKQTTFGGAWTPLLVGDLSAASELFISGRYRGDLS